ncbi:MAG: hypothetical protein KTR16_08635 [Acidiferrobacterales bacterium]|nr:hypothetical protein [Acidiferrobacterales bacterium]
MTINKYTDRVDTTNLINLLGEKLNGNISNEVRNNLFHYLVRYNSDYHFSGLENVFALMSKKLIENVALSNGEEELIKAGIDYGMYEYFISLNNITEALSIINNNQALDKDMVVEIINHVWEAYSCNEQDFLDREINYLVENI